MRKDGIWEIFLSESRGSMIIRYKEHWGGSQGCTLWGNTDWGIIYWVDLLLAEEKNRRPCWKHWILSKLCVPRKQHSTPFVFQEMADPSALKEYEVRLFLFFLMTSIKTPMTPCPCKTPAPFLFLIAMMWIISFL